VIKLSVENGQCGPFLGFTFIAFLLASFLKIYLGLLFHPPPLPPPLPVCIYGFAEYENLDVNVIFPERVQAGFSQSDHFLKHF
jgi:hypothetical protein